MCPCWLLKAGSHYGTTVAVKQTCMPLFKNKVKY